MPNKNSKKARRAGASGGEAGEMPGGFTVVHAESGRPVYLSAANGISEAEAHRLSGGLVASTKVVPL